MSRFLTGLFSGIILTSLVALVALVPRIDVLNTILLRSLISGDQEQDSQVKGDTDPLARFKSDAIDPGYMMELDAEFLDPDDARTVHDNDFSLLRIEPVYEFHPLDFDKVCVLSFDHSVMSIGANLSQSAQDKLAADLMKSDDPYPRQNYGTKQRFMFESSGDQLYWFWVNDLARKQYSDYLSIHPDDFNFIMKVPINHLYEFQSVLQRGISDAPLKGCSDKVKLSDIPEWDSLITETWRY